MINNIKREFALALLEAMNIAQSEFIIMAVSTKLDAVHPRHYTEIMISLMDNTDTYSKPIEKVSNAIQRVADTHFVPDTIESLVSFIKRQYRGRVLSDHVEGVFKKGVKIAVSADGNELVNLYNGKNLSDSDTLEVYAWAFENFEKIGKIQGYSYDHTKQIAMIEEEPLMIESNNSEYVSSILAELKQKVAP